MLTQMCRSIELLVLFFSLVLSSVNSFQNINTRVDFATISDRSLFMNCDRSECHPSSYNERSQQKLARIAGAALVALATSSAVNAADGYAVAPTATEAKLAAAAASAALESGVDYGTFKIPYEHVNQEFRQYLGKKATIVFNMKIDDPQTVTQFPDLLEIYKRYKSEGLNVHAFPTEQGWFEADDDKTIRAKSKEYYGFGDYPNSVVFDKVDILGPSANPFYATLTKDLLTPNGYGRITLNYEKFLLDPAGNPLRRYPRKFSAYDMESDIQALLKGDPLPEPSPQYLKAWREAKREAVKSEYAFRYNYNYYTAPDSMYKYNPQQDAKKLTK
mmetsp:Transcript_27730/g.46619  ORF Transcript_27730/g.46619 Transcript_27730/m.46619 type:complete len:331 (+) Transcript_27730:87-1079(+)